MQNITILYRPRSLTPRIVEVTCPADLEGQELNTYLNILLGTDWIWPAK